MSARPAKTPCLGDRVAALADGSLRDDVRDRALAHTLTCTACRDALDVERLIRERLRALPDPQPSTRLLTQLLALGETGGPVPPRRGTGPGMPRPALVPLAPPAASSGTVRPGGGTHPGSRAAVPRRSRRPFVVAAAGALGAGFVAASVFSASVGAGPSPRPAVAELTVQSSTSAQQRFGPARFAPAMLAPAVTGPATGFRASTGATVVRPAVLSPGTP